jgi:cell division protein ZapA
MAATEPLIPLNILIGDRNYRIKVASSNEETVRKTLKTINEKVLEFKTQFAGKDMQDYVAMVLVWYATQNNGPSDKTPEASIQPLLTELEKLDQKIQKALEEVE